MNMIKKDEFNNEINIGDHVLFNDQGWDARFFAHEYGTVTKFTEHFIVIKPDNLDAFHAYAHPDRIYRKSNRIIVVEDWKNKYLYLAADFDNYKKNSVKRNREQSEAGKRQVLLNMLEIVDDFERIPETDINDGTRNIINKMINELQKFEVVKYVPEDNKFNANYFEAISLTDIDDKEKDNTIHYILQNCYLMNNEVLRIGKCVVDKYKEKTENNNE